MTPEARTSKIDGYEADLLSGRVFSLCSASAASMFGYQPPGSARSYARALGVLAKAASLGDGHAWIVSRILREMVPNMTDKDQVTRIWRTAAEVVGKGWFDTVRAGSPEPGRRSDSEMAYSLRDRLVIYCYLHAVARCFVPNTGWGWAHEALLEREGLAHSWLVDPFRK